MRIGAMITDTPISACGLTLGGRGVCRDEETIFSRTNCGGVASDKAWDASGRWPSDFRARLAGTGNLNDAREFYELLADSVRV